MSDEVKNPLNLHQLVMSEVSRQKKSVDAKPIRFFAKPGSKTYEQIKFCATRSGLSPNEWLRSFVDWGYRAVLSDMVKNKEDIGEQARKSAKS